MCPLWYGTFWTPIILMSKFLFPGHDSPVRSVPCPRGYCHSFSSGSGDNVSITRNCYNKHEVASGHLISVVARSIKPHYAGPGAVLAPHQGRHGRDARGEQVLHPHHHGRGLHRVPLQLQRLQQPGQQHPGGSSYRDQTLILPFSEYSFHLVSACSAEVFLKVMKK